jgi:hypothetical protein
MGLPQLERQPTLLPTEVTRIPKPTGIEANHLYSVIKINLKIGGPAFSRFFPPLKLFLSSLRSVIANWVFRCVTPAINFKPIIIAPFDYGFRALLMYNIPFLLAN